MITNWNRSISKEDVAGDCSFQSINIIRKFVETFNTRSFQNAFSALDHDSSRRIRYIRASKLNVMNNKFGKESTIWSLLRNSVLK